MAKSKWSFGDYCKELQKQIDGWNEALDKFQALGGEVKFHIYHDGIGGRLYDVTNNVIGPEANIYCYENRWEKDEDI